MVDLITVKIASSNLVQASCPHCGDRIHLQDEVITTENRPVSPGDFTVCLSCREFIRFDKQCCLRIMSKIDWNELAVNKELFIAMFQWRQRILLDQLREQTLGRIANGISRIR